MESASVATAFARYDFPVPGGPYKRMPLHGFLFPAEMRSPCRLLRSCTLNTGALVADSLRSQTARASENEESVLALALLCSEHRSTGGIATIDCASQ